MFADKTGAVEEKSRRPGYPRLQLAQQVRRGETLDNLDGDGA